MSRTGEEDTVGAHLRPLFGLCAYNKSLTLHFMGRVGGGHRPFEDLEDFVLSLPEEGLNLLPSNPPPPPHQCRLLWL